MEGSIKDIWDKIEIIGTICGGILIPIAVVFVGNIISKQKTKKEHLNQEASRISDFIKHLSSDNENERIIALKCAQYLKSKNQLPEELLMAIGHLTISDSVESTIAQGIIQYKPETEIDFLKKIIESFDDTGKNIENYFTDKKYKWIKKVALINTSVRNLIIVNSHLIPKELYSSITSILHHLESWLKGYRKHMGRYIEFPSEEHFFDYFAAPDYPFPYESIKSIKSYIETN